jgi:hypothetical protein
VMAASAAFRAAGSCWGDAGWMAPAEQHICDNMSKGEIDASEAASRAQHSLPPSKVELSDLAHLVPAATLSTLHCFQRALSSSSARARSKVVPAWGFARMLRLVAFKHGGSTRRFRGMRL